MTLFPASFDLSLLNGNNGFVIDGIDKGDFLGRPVSSTGDVNGDGIDDLIMGARSADPNGNNSAGESYVVYGSSTSTDRVLSLSSLDGTNGFVINGIDPGDLSGRRVSGAGDVNGDGLNDLIIGARYASPNGKNGAGESYVVYGSSTFTGASLNLSSLDGSTGFVINGIDVGDRSGVSVSSAGDVNNDGINDLIIGARFASPNNRDSASESYVVYGSSTFTGASIELSLLDGSNGFVLNGIDAGDSSGFSVSGAGDVNGDGIDDVIVSAHQADPNSQDNAGESYVVYGSSTFTGASIELSLLDGSTGFVINGIDAGDSSGFSVSGAGDVNGDGIDDVIVGAYQADSNSQNNAGESYVVYGSSTFTGASITLSLLDGSTGFVINGVAANDNSGVSVSNAGDINNDGVDDIIIGAYLADPNSQNNAGKSYVVYGVSNTPTEGADSIEGTAGDDSLSLGGGDDVAFAAAGNDIVFGGDGNDGIYGDDGDDILNGGEGTDYLIGQGDNDTLNGDGGDDFLIGGSGDDIMNGGLGMDAFYGDDGNDQMFGGGGKDVLFGGLGDDEMNGGSDNDVMQGSDGADTLNGDDGNDDLNGDADNDTLNGGAGVDGLKGGTGADTLNGGDDGDFLYGQLGNDMLNGDAGNDMLIGGDGSDTLYGGTDNDTLYGGTDGDTMHGDEGMDTLYGETGNDIMSGGDGIDTLQGGLGDDRLSGGAGDDNLSGEDGIDTIAGGDGDDRLNGGNGNDILTGGDGDDGLNGGNGDDTLNGNSGDDYLIGDAGNDVITGGSGDDYIIGSAGDDRLIGGVLNTAEANQVDTLTGGDGADTFVVRSMYNSFQNSDYAVVLEFATAEDAIELGDGLYSLADVGGNLPGGVGLYNGSDLIAIIQGYTAENLSLTESYFVQSPLTA